ncbi:MAG: hypothetical protein ACRDY5_04855, partial [Acidimicrobiales bacterium]
RQAMLERAWRSATRDHRPPDNPVLRITVAGVGPAGMLRDLSSVGPLRLVPLVDKPTGRFAWRWPLRIAVADGPRAMAWTDQLRSGTYVGQLYDIRILGEDDADPVELLIVDADEIPDDPGHPVARPSQATCVVMVGRRSSPGDLVARAAAATPGPSMAVGVAEDGVDWLEPVVYEMTHDRPLDVALATVVPGAIVAGTPGLIEFTAVARWAVALADQLGLPEQEHLRQVVRQSYFDAEAHGASEVADRSRQLAAAGADTTVEVRVLAKGPELPTARPEPPVPPKRRRLVAGITSGGRVRRAALVPGADHELEVRIAVPRRGEVASAHDFDEEAVPAGDGVAHLTVDVSCEAVGLRATADIVLNTADLQAASTPAMFCFRTGDDGSVLDIKVVVLHQGRPIQAAHLVGTVRAQPAPNDRVQLWDLPLTSGPEPRPDTTAAQVTLDARDRVLRRLGGGPAATVDLTRVEAMLGDIEQRASRVMAADDAPSSFRDESARQLLVKLARWGAELADHLAPLEMADAATIAVLVTHATAVTPLELAYDGPAPYPGARLCTHATGGLPAAGGACTEVSKRVVCPYAFWGMRLVVARTFEMERSTHRAGGVGAGTADPAALDLRPVLYAAADRADLASGAAYRPSDLLERSLVDLVGREAVTRVRSWRAWRAAVRSTRPQLLVVLGHTETADGESTIEIGRASRLARPDLDRAVLRRDPAPPPLVVLLACASAAAGDTFGGLPAAFTGRGAGAVVATLTKLRGPHGARAAAAVVEAIVGTGTAEGVTLGTALTAARRRLVSDGFLIGLLLVAHGEIDLKIVA